MTADELVLAAQGARSTGINSLATLITLLHLSERDNGSFCSDLARVAMVSDASMSGTLDRMEAAGTIERVANGPDRDRRMKRIYITEKGLAAVARIIP